MTTYRHTFDYSRVGVGDMIAIDPRGAPFLCTAIVPTEFTVNFWYATNRRASTRNTADWTQWSGSGAPPFGATLLAVNVLSVTGTVPEGTRVTYTVAGTDYRGAKSARVKHSGSHVAFGGVAEFSIPLPEKLVVWIDTGDPANSFSDVDGQVPIVDTATILRLNNKGTAGGYITDAASTLVALDTGLVGVLAGTNTTVDSMAFEGRWNEGFVWEQPNTVPFPELSFGALWVSDAHNATNDRVFSIIGTAHLGEGSPAVLAGLGEFGGATPFRMGVNGGNPSGVQKGEIAGFGDVLLDNWHGMYRSWDNAIPSLTYSSVNGDYRTRFFGAAGTPDLPNTIFGDAEQNNTTNIKQSLDHAFRIGEHSGKVLAIFVWDADISPFQDQLEQYCLFRLGLDPLVATFPVADA